MTETTDSRQIGMMVNTILAKHKIDNLQMEIDLSSALIAYMREKNKGTPTGKIRERVLTAMNIAKEKAIAYDDMARRVKESLGIEVSGRERYDRLIDFLIAKDLNGETIERYATWQKENPYTAPAIFKIAEKPDLLEVTWGLAFRGKRKTDETRPEYDEHGILKSW